MDWELAEMIIEAIETEGEDTELRSDYSGRGMYRESTYGIVTDETLSFVTAAIINNANIFVNENGHPIFTNLQTIRVDQMGLGYVYY